MRVAIIGAGLAGLACAHELEKYNIDATVFERNSFIGESFNHVGAVLGIIARPIKNQLDYISNELGLDVKPINSIDKIIHCAPEKTTVIRGKLGYFFERSKGPSDMKVQLRSTLKKTKFKFNFFADYEVLAKEYDYVVVANGDSAYSKELGCWISWVNTYLRGATVLGDFDPKALVVWLNKDYCKNGYAYLTPYDNRRASLVLIATDVSEKEIDHYWELFLYSEKLNYKIVEEFRLSHKGGHVYPHKIGNIYLAGNAGGAIDPFLGFGVENSLVTGVMAARSIATGSDYEKLLKNMVKKNYQLNILRKGYNRLTNAGYNLLFTAIGLPVVKQVTYYTPLNIIKLGSAVINVKNRLKIRNQ